MKIASTPIETHKALLKDEEAEDVDVYLYRSMIGSLMYLTAFRSDIMFAICACARFQVTPKVSHLHAVKRIFRYLKGQPKLGIWYPRDSPFDLEAFSNRKPEGRDERFHQIVDFLNSTHIKYALTENPTIYVSLIYQFWQTASASTSENKELEITATIDRRVQTVTEASIRMHLKLEDSNGIITLPNTKFFEQLALMGIFKGYNGVDIPLFPTMLVQGPNFQGEGSTVPVESHHTPISAPSTSQPLNLPPYMQTTHVVEEATTMPHDLPLPRVHSLGSDEGSMTLHELTVLCTTLSKKVESLESNLKQTKLAYGAAYTKLIMKVKKLENRIESSKARRRVRLIVLEDKCDLEDPSKQGRKIAQIDEDEGITLKKTKLQLEKERLGYEEAMRLQEQLDEEDRQRIARVHEEANTFNVEEWDSIQAQIEANEELAKKLQAEERGKFSEVEKARLLVEMINERKRLSSLTVRRVQYFVPMDFELEDQRLKRAGQESLKDPTKIQKIREASGSVQEQSDEEPKVDELSQEQLQQLMIIGPEEGMNVEALQTKYPIIDWEVYSEDTIKDDLVKLWSLVHKRFNSTKLTYDKAKELWVELKRLFEPDENDTLWKIQRYMHDPLTWKLYDTCGVHHVSTE
ncbi:hypothetical protein Tco_0369096 [Tanacetum coccineum]